jgi:hypothetical protein
MSICSICSGSVMLFSFSHTLVLLLALAEIYTTVSFSSSAAHSLVEHEFIEDGMHAAPVRVRLLLFLLLIFAVIRVTYKHAKNESLFSF